MWKIIEVVIIAIYNKLPNDPFVPILDSISVSGAEYLSFMNWFLPFDICSTMMLAWLDCILVYYAFVLIKKLAYFTIKNVFSKISLTTLVGGIGEV